MCDFASHCGLSPNDLSPITIYCSVPVSSTRGYSQQNKSFVRACGIRAHLCRFGSPGAVRYSTSCVRSGRWRFEVYLVLRHLLEVFNTHEESDFSRAFPSGQRRLGDGAELDLPPSTCSAHTTTTDAAARAATPRIADHLVRDTAAGPTLAAMLCGARTQVHSTARASHLAMMEQVC